MAIMVRENRSFLQLACFTASSFLLLGGICFAETVRFSDATTAEQIQATCAETIRTRESKLGGEAQDQLLEAAGDQEVTLALMRHELLRHAGAETIQSLQKEERGNEFLTLLFNDHQWLEMLLGSGPWEENANHVLTHLHTLWLRDPACVHQRETKTLVTAVALEFGVRNWPSDRAWQRYTFYRDSSRNELLHPSYDTLVTWEKRYLVGHELNRHGEPASQEWLRDNVKLPIHEYRSACWQLAYRGHNMFGDSVQGPMYYYPFEGAFGSFSEMTRFVGGVCGRLSGYGAGAAVANGIPASTMGEPGHCAYAVRVAPGKWMPAYSLSWKRSLHFQMHNDPSWNMLVLDDVNLSQREAWLQSQRHLWQARFHENDKPRATAAFILALRAQLTSYSIWNEYGQYLTRQKADPNAWLVYHNGVLKGLNAYPEIAWKLISKHAYPAMLPQFDTKQKIALMGQFHKSLDGWGPVRWDFGKAIDKQMSYFKKDEATEFAYLRGMVICHAKSEDYLAPVLTWGQAKYAKQPAKSERFLNMVATLFSQSGDEANAEAVLAMCSQAILDAEKNRDHEGFVAIGQIIEALSSQDVATENNDEATLLSKGGMVTFSSVSSRWDRNPYMHWNLLSSSRLGKFHTDEEESPWVEVSLANFGLLERIEIVNTTGHTSRAVPLAIEVSVDGEKWSEVTVLSKAQSKWKVDLKGKSIRARHVRLKKQGKGILHLRNIRIYGTRLS